jgi:hypothetical protein
MAVRRLGVNPRPLVGRVETLAAGPRSAPWFVRGGELPAAPSEIGCVRPRHRAQCDGRDVTNVTGGDFQQPLVRVPLGHVWGTKRRINFPLTQKCCSEPVCSPVGAVLTMLRSEVRFLLAPRKIPGQGRIWLRFGT